MTKYDSDGFPISPHWSASNGPPTSRRRPVTMAMMRILMSILYGKTNGRGSGRFQISSMWKRYHLNAFTEA